MAKKRGVSSSFRPRAKPRHMRPKRPRTLDPKTQKRLKTMRDRARQRQGAIKQRRSPATAPASPTVDEQTQLRLSSLQSKFDDLQDDVTLASVYDDMGAVEGVLLTLDNDLDALRAQGYVFRNYLERKIDVITAKWENVSEAVAGQVEEEGDELEAESDKVERLVQRAMGGNTSAISRAESAVETLESKVSAARSALQNRYDDIARTVQQTRTQLDELKWSFEQAQQASFDFLEAEYLVLACQAELLEGPSDDEGPQGILYLTDERLIFEQKEKVATKKFLFVTTESETVQEIEFEAPLGWIEDLEAQDKRKLLKKKELLNLTLSPEAPFSQVTIRLHKGAKNEDWVRHINRARNGEIERERIAEAAEEKEAAAEAVAAAPTSCATCGAPFSAAIVRGQSEITCEYCGSLTRL